MKKQVVSEEHLEIIFENSIPSSGYLNNLLSQNNEIDSKSDEFDFSTVFKNSTIAPYVTPCIDGLPVYAEAGIKNRYSLPYTKMEDGITPCDIFRTDLFIDGELKKYSTSANDDTRRWELGRLQIIDAHRKAIGNLLEQQTVSLVETGTIDTRSSYANGEIITFPRDTTLSSFSLNAGTEYWDTSTGDPIATIEKVADLFENLGYILTDIVVPSDVWLAFKNNTKVNTLRNSPANTPWASKMPSPLPFLYNNGVRTYNLDNALTGNVTFHIYNERYQKLDTSTGTPKYTNVKFATPKKALFIARRDGQFQVGKVWGKIKSQQALKAKQTDSRVFVYEWEEKDATQIITQASPLMFGDANSFFGVQVIA